MLTQPSVRNREPDPTRPDPTRPDPRVHPTRGQLCGDLQHASALAQSPKEIECPTVRQKLIRIQADREAMVAPGDTANLKDRDHDHFFS